MEKKVQPLTSEEADKTLLKRELEKGLASGVSKRTPAQIHDAFRKAREAA
jgi:hypothetical protein